MSIPLKIVSSIGIASMALFGLGSLGGCLGDDEDPEGGTGGSGGSSGNSGTGGSGATGTACASPITLASSKATVATFDEYTGGADLTTWSFPMGGDPAGGIFAGTFVYGDETTGYPETYEMVAGNDSTYALSISDTLAEEYGGGMGLWISECLNATAFSGLSFWVRGDSPSGTAKLSILMQESTSSTAAKVGDKIGTCSGTSTTCIHPTFTFPVSDTWTEVEVPWSMFMAGSAPGVTVTPDGRNIWQIQFDVGLVWAADAAGVYAPTPAPYELVLDDLKFY